MKELFEAVHREGGEGERGEGRGERGEGRGGGR